MASQCKYLEKCISRCATRPPLWGVWGTLDDATREHFARAVLELAASSPLGVWDSFDFLSQVGVKWAEHTVGS